MKDKLGRFSISNEMLINLGSLENIMKLMGRMIIVRAEQRFDINGIEYIAMSEYFKKLNQGEKVPRYKFIFSTCEIKCEAV